MFNVETGFSIFAKQYGRKQAIAVVADINEHSRRYTAREVVDEDTDRPSLKYGRSLLDYNEHFIEFSNWGEDLRSLYFMLAIIIFVLPPSVALIGVIAGYVAGGFDATTIFLTMFLIANLFIVHLLWPAIGAQTLFTQVRARYRFNRTTGKVYVLRPARYGGNVVLDWNRVQAHVTWRGPGKMTFDQLNDPTARLARLNSIAFASLLLYWPPLDNKDPKQQGEEVLWVGPERSEGAHWQYIRTFMEEGIDAVPIPNAYEWLRKGYSTPGQHNEEVAMHPFIVHDLLSGCDNPSASTQLAVLVQFLWTPLHSLAERFCSWPTFPEEWNSDCGQRRRESGIGPEEPLRWQAK